MSSQSIDATAIDTITVRNWKPNVDTRVIIDLKGEMITSTSPMSVSVSTGMFLRMLLDINAPNSDTTSVALVGRIKPPFVHIQVNGVAEADITLPDRWSDRVSVVAIDSDVTVNHSSETLASLSLHVSANGRIFVTGDLSVDQLSMCTTQASATSIYAQGVYCKYPTLRVSMQGSKEFSVAGRAGREHRGVFVAEPVEDSLAQLSIS